MTDLHSHLRTRLLAATTELGIDRTAAEPLLRLDPPKNRDHGDVALGAFQLAKLAGKAPPALAAELAAKITPDDVVEGAVAAGPFVNIKFRRSALARAVLTAIARDEAPYGKAAGNDDVVGIEPMAAPTNALRKGTYSVAVPGRPASASFTITV